MGSRDAAQQRRRCHQAGWLHALADQQTARSAKQQNRKQSKSAPLSSSTRMQQQTARTARRAAKRNESITHAPLSSSTRMHPTLQMSQGKDQPSPRITSGALHSGGAGQARFVDHALEACAVKENIPCPGPEPLSAPYKSTPMGGRLLASCALNSHALAAGQTRPIRIRAGPGAPVVPRGDNGGVVV